MAQAKEKKLVKATCTRCGGTGHYSFNLMHGTMCYGCEGKGYVIITEAAAKARATREAKAEASYKAYQEKEAEREAAIRADSANRQAKMDAHFEEIKEALKWLPGAIDLNIGTSSQTYIIEVTGKTFPVKDELKKLGFTWDSTIRGWSITLWLHHDSYK